ncbi:MAG: type I polyketide synthase [Chlorogloeopsis fritschii C42_A2020_084]|uniref:type I polyketide synthase n=1 Tax=Chlorogloeopsis fritschii TaxID=1124 RepID=UPI001A0B9A6F|nr:type I polyketide synthase [Chlorogloeopsis fritschii]MBF2007111.1 type I polyketide synthase [Chlorogloeopsis fritschii C42_A2020_084]
MGINEQNKNPKIAIVGMDCFLGGCKGLDAFERSVYEGTQHFIDVPPQRWQAVEKQEYLLKNYGFESSNTPQGAYIKDFEIDFSDFQLAPETTDKLNPQELLMLKVADRALKDAKLNRGSRVGVVIVVSAKLSVRLIKQEAKDSIANLCSISNLWNFAGPSFTLTAEQNSVFKALEVAQKLLSIKEVDAVVVGAVELAGSSASVLARNQMAKVNTGVNTLSYDRDANGWMVGEGAAAVVLKLHETAQKDSDRIYGVIDALNILKQDSTSNTLPEEAAVTQVCHQAFDSAGIKPTDIGYLEVFGSGVPQQDESEIKGLLQAYRTCEPKLTCALGSVKANIGHTYTASGIVSLIKTALCLYHRYIPGVPQWTAPKMPELWQNTPFYVATESKPWFLEQGATKRIAAINSMEMDGSYAHLILSEEATQKERSSRYLEQTPFYLFPLAGDDCPTLLEQIHALEQTIAISPSLSTAASLTFAGFQQRQNAAYTVVIVGRNHDELTREIQRALKGVADAFDTGKDWQTPVGSYFTSKPLGKKGTVAFVYPGAYSSYIGIARNLFRLFPKIHDDPIIKSVYSRVANIEKILYPRSLNKLSKRQLEALEQRLIDDPVAMLESEMGVAGLLSAILRNYFQLQPDCAFGYSLGETSMMLAQGLWTHFHEGSQSLNSSTLFKTELSGPKNAVRRFWELPQIQDGESSEFWSTYILMCPVSLVQEALKHENHVYLILINTPQEVAIAGDIQACQRVIETLNCDAFRAPFNHVIHCEAIRSKYDELVKINTLPVQNVPNTVFYSAAEYKPITLDSNSIGHSIAKVLVQQLDFPRLINRVWEDGAKIFIEVGAGGNCSRWISGTLKQKEHIAISLNKRGIDEYISIIRALAKLVSHRVNMDLSSLYSQVQDISRKDESRVKTITLCESKFNFTLLHEEDQEIFPSTTSDSLINSTNKQPDTLVDLKEFEYTNSSFLQSAVKKFESVGKPQNYELTTQNGEFQILPNHSSKNDNLIHETQMLNLRDALYQKLSENSSQATRTHHDFLQARQESLYQISAIIQLQLNCLQHIFEKSSSNSGNEK